MDDKRGSNHRVTVEMLAISRNDYDDVNNGANRSQIDGKLDKESLVVNDRHAEVVIKTEENNVARSILVSLVVLLLLAVCIVVVVLIVSNADSGKSTKQTCTTKDCVLSASKLIENSNLSVNPCIDFYEYACGGWKAKNFIPDSKSEWNGFTSRRETIAHILKRALDSNAYGSKDSAVNKVLDFYKSCTNEKQLNALGAEPLKNLLEGLGSWPLLNKTWSENGWSMEDSIFAYHSIFFSYFHHGRPAPILNTYVKVDDRNSSTHIISVLHGNTAIADKVWVHEGFLQMTVNFPGSMLTLQVDEPDFLLIPRNFKADESRWKEIYSAYDLMLREYVKLLGGNSSTTQIKELLEFEMKLANASTPIDEFRDVVRSYKKMTLKTLTETVGNQFNWVRYLQMVFKMQKVKIDNTTVIGTRSMKYFVRVNNILSTTPKRTIAIYLGWVVVHKLGPHLSEKFQNVDFKFQQVLLGVNKAPSKWFRCLETVEDNIDMGIARIFSKTALQDNAKEVGKEVIEGVKRTFIERLKELDWMDEATKKKGDTKANIMIYDIGYPDFINDVQKLNQIYESLDISNTSYLQNLVNSFKWRRENNLNLINMPVNKRIWDIAPTQVNAYYDVSNNKMVFLAGILGDPFFDSKAPKSLVYGSFGFVAGHEITHGFDDQGRRYDPNGDLKDWWTASSTRAFKSKASCIQKQYSAYTFRGLNVNGNMTLGENIADIGGLKIAYSAYKRWVKENGNESKLPGINLNHDQLFFLSFGQLWCALYNEQKGKRIVQNDVHSLPDLRVKGPLSNMKEFAEAFNCPANSPMMRKNKCEMW